MKEGDVRWGKRPEKEGWLLELVGDQNPGPEASRRSKSGGSKGDARGGAMEKSGYIRVMKGKEVRGDDPIKHFFHKGIGSTS